MVSHKVYARDENGALRPLSVENKVKLLDHEYAIRQLI